MKNIFKYIYYINKIKRIYERLEKYISKKNEKGLFIRY
jgi:hypothetical protein